MDEGNIREFSQAVASMSDQNLFECVQNVEKLYMKLMMEHNNEIQRSHSLGLFKTGKRKPI